MTNPDSKRAFISHVHEDEERVDHLCAVLEAAGIPYWRDRNDLGPGDAWKTKIREAIRNGAVFLACFSTHSIAKGKSYMNEELKLAIEEFRQMPPGRVWLIPVRFDAVDVPEWDLGAGMTLRDLNYVDLFGPGHIAEAAKLVTRIHQLMGDKQMSAASALAAVEQASTADRADLMKRMTKEMLLDPLRRIELDDLVSHEVQRVAAVLGDPMRVTGPIAGTNEEQIVRVAEQAHEIWAITEPFCASLQVAARWGSPDSLAPWAEGLRSFVAKAKKIEGGVEALLNLRYLPGVVGIVTGTLACVAGGRWANLKALVVDPTVREQYVENPLPLVEATDPFKVFGNNEWVALTLARATVENKDMTEALHDFAEKRQGKYYTPASEWLHHVLRPLFADQIPDQDAYDYQYDQMEAILCALAQDQTNLRAEGDSSRRAYRNSHWFGRATWRAAHGRGNPIRELQHQLTSQGSSWGPLKEGLFGGDLARATAALNEEAEEFAQLSGRRS